MNARLPNILLITADQWRGDHLGAAGYPGPLTPHLDALARQGTLFARHYCQAYPCGPSRASLLTGLYPHKHRSVRNGIPLDSRHPTLFTELRRAGYRPTLFGYTDSTLDPRGQAPGTPGQGDAENVCAGLEVDTLLTQHATPWLEHLRVQGYAVDDPAAGRAAILQQRPFTQAAAFDAAHSEAAFLADRFIQWLERVTGAAAAAPAGRAGAADAAGQDRGAARAGAPPFCAHLSFFPPHPPFAVAAPYHRLIDPADVPMPVRGATPECELSQHPLLAALFSAQQVGAYARGLSGPAHRQGEAQIRQVRAIYAGMVAEVDHQIGRVIAALHATDTWRETLIIVTADHGEQLFDHWMLSKTGYFDQSAHIPLIVRDPRPGADAARGRQVAQFTESVDVMPTVLAAAGLPAQENGDGRSLLPFCVGENPDGWRDEAHWSYDFRNIRTQRMERLLGLPSEWCNLQVVRTRDLKYVHFAGMPPVLFDLREDPHERVNRAADPAAQALRLQGLERMLTWRQRHEEKALTGYLAQEGMLYRDH